MVKIISPVTQRQVEAEQVDFEAKAEPWSSYELTDGTILKVRVILTGVLRIEGEYDQSGNPIYVVSSQNVVQANAPKKIRGTPTVGSMPPTRPCGGRTVPFRDSREWVRASRGRHGGERDCRGPARWFGDDLGGSGVHPRNRSSRSDVRVAGHPRGSVHDRHRRRTSHGARPRVSC